MTEDKKPSKRKRSKENGEEPEVGYKKPPKSTRFKRGRSGNVKGRPKGSRNLLNLIKDELDKQVVLQENGRALKLTKRQVVAKRVVNQAINGDARSIGTLIGMDKENKDEDDQIVELSPEDQEQFERFKERLVEKSKQKSKPKPATEEKTT